MPSIAIRTVWQDIIMCDLAPSLEAILNGSALNFAQPWQNVCNKIVASHLRFVAIFI